MRAPLTLFAVLMACGTTSISAVDAGSAATQDAGYRSTDAGLELSARVSAATETAENNALCTAITPFYWQIGDAQGAKGAGSRVAAGSAARYNADSTMPIASASKWLYSTYFVQRVDGGVSPDDIKFLTFSSGYSSFDQCGAAQTIGACLEVGTNGEFTPATENKFTYGGAHMQKHAVLNGLGSLGEAQFAAELKSQLGADIYLTFSTPQPAGGGVSTAAQYAKVLRKIINGQLKMREALGTHAVCTNPSSCPSAISSPITGNEAFNYSLGHWLEDDPVTGDGAFSSAGAFGFYPWVDATKTWYGVIARVKLSAGSGFDSIQCGRLIRKAWVTGRPQL